MPTLGELLKKEREEARLSAEQVATVLKVRKDYLENVEKDNYEELPPDVYIKGFLKNYARLLGLDEKKVVEIYKNQRGDLKVDAGWEKKKEGLKRKPKLVITPEFFFGGISFLLVAVVVIYFLRAAGSFSRPPVLEITSPRENETVEEGQILIRGRTSESSKLEINGQEVDLREEGEFETQAVLMGGMNEIRVRAENKFGKVTEKRLLVNYKTEGETAGGAVEKKTIVQLRVDSEPVWIEVESEDENFSETLAAYSEKILEIKKPTKVVVGKANGVYFTKNGGDLEIFGESGEKEERWFEP